MQKPARYFILSILIFSYTFSYSQRLKYDVILLGKKIGEAEIEKKDSAGYVNYTLYSHSDAKIIGMEKKNDMTTAAIFHKGGKMHSSYFHDVKNKKELLTKAVWQGNKLVVEKDGKQTAITEEVPMSSLLLYYIEPKDHQKVFSERVGEFFEIVKQKDGRYKVALGDYNALYTYQSGKLTKLEMKDAAGEVVMNLQN